MKFLSKFFFYGVICLSLIAGSKATAFERTSQMGAINPLLELRNQIDALTTRLQTMETTLADAIACGDAGQQYTGIACIVVPEVDPTVKTHGTKTMVAPCAGTDTAQYYNTATNSWRCKTLTTP